MAMGFASPRHPMRTDPAAYRQLISDGMRASPKVKAHLASINVKGKVKPNKLGVVRERLRWAWKLVRYGLSLDQWDQLVLQHEGRCNVCSKIRELVVEHRHRDGAIRGLVCQGCNAKIAWFERMRIKIALHMNEPGLLPEVAGGAWILPAVLGGLQAAGSMSAANAAGTATAKQNELIDYMLNKKRKTYDPIEENTIIPGLLKRQQQGPRFAQDWASTAKYLRTPMRLGGPS